MQKFLVSITTLLAFNLCAIAFASSEQFSNSPTPSAFAQYLENADSEEILSSYQVVAELDFVDASAKDCAAQKYFLDKALHAHPFGLALIRLAWHCANVSGKPKIAAALALRFDAVLEMYLIENDGKFLSSAIPVNSFWDIIAIVDSKIASMLHGEFSSIMNLGDLRYYCWLKNQDEQYELLHFNLTGNHVKAGRSKNLYSTPAARMFLIFDLIQNLADEGVVEAEGFQIKQSSSGANAVESLRKRYPIDMQSIRIVLPLLTSGEAKCNQADATALAADAKSQEPAALINLALERVLGLCSAADASRSHELLRQAQTKTQFSIAALFAEGLLAANALDKLPDSMLAQLRKDGVKDPRAAMMAFIRTKAAKDFEAVQKRHRSVGFVSMILAIVDSQNAADPEKQKQAACNAAKYGTSQPMRACVALLKTDSESDARIELEKALLFLMPSTDTKPYFEANKKLVGELFESNRVDEALNWAVSAAVLGEPEIVRIGGYASLGGKLNTIIDQEFFLSMFVSEEKTREILKRQFELGEASDYLAVLSSERKRCLEGETLACYTIVAPVVMEVMRSRDFTDEAINILERVWKDDPTGKYSPAASFYLLDFFSARSKLYDPITGALNYEKLLDPGEDLKRNWAQVRCTASDKNAFSPQATIAVLETLVAVGQPDFLDTAAACYAAMGQFDRAILLVDQALDFTQKNEKRRRNFLKKRHALFSNRKPVVINYPSPR